MTVRDPMRRAILRVGSAVALAPSLGWSPSAPAAADPSRIALVVGNDAYAGAPLGNAVHDASAMSELLRRAGFAVELRRDVDQVGLAASARKFAEDARRPEVELVFFYFAGHGAQLDWRNYLLPVDARVNTAADLPAQCLDLASLLAALSLARGKTFVIVLDACRDNPFGSAFRPAQKGLSQFDAPAGSLLAFATAPGSVAADASAEGGRSGLYAQHLVRELGVPATRIEDALKRVRLAVRMSSRGAQVPWESTSLETDVFLFPAARTLSEQELEHAFVRELELWNRTKASKRTQDWVEYLREYPSGKFAEIAQSRLAYFARQEEEARALAVARLPLPVAPIVSSSAATTAMPSATLAQVDLIPPAQSATPPALAAAAAPAVGAPLSAPAPTQAQGGANVFALEAGPGKALPVLMRPSPSALSAGSYALNRRFSVGDRYEFVKFDPSLMFPRRSNFEWTVTRVDLDADRVEVDGGSVVLDTMGNTLNFEGRLYDPRVQTVPVVLQVGYKWSSRFSLLIPGRSTSVASHYDYQVVARESVSIALGSVEAFRIEGRSHNETTNARFTYQSWLVPGLNVPLRFELRRFNALSLEAADVRELVAVRQKVWTPA